MRALLFPVPSVGLHYLYWPQHQSDAGTPPVNSALEMNIRIIHTNVQEEYFLSCTVLFFISPFGTDHTA